MPIIKILSLLIFLIALPTTHAAAENIDNYLDYAKEKVEKAIKNSKAWDGPKFGPKSVHEKKIVFVGSDLRNGGVYGVAKGVSEAVSHLDWQLNFIDGRGSKLRQGAAVRKAIGLRPHAIVLGGVDALIHKDVLAKARALGIVVIGWHAAEFAGKNESLGLFTNITTSPFDVAEIAALLAIVNSEGKAKVVVFNDPNYKIATLKANVMVGTIARCSSCEVLELTSLGLDQVAEEMPKVFEELRASYKDKITHFLTINDLYIDYVTPFLESMLGSGSDVPLNISAGDGSKAAYERINNQKFQLATVPEPLYLHGWQIVDELNRAFSNTPPSGYSTPVHLVTASNSDELINNRKAAYVYDPDNGYRESYLSIWRGN